MLAACGGDAPPPQTQAQPFTAANARSTPTAVANRSRRLRSPYAQLDRATSSIVARCCFNVPRFLGFGCEREQSHRPRTRFVRCSFIRQEMLVGRSREIHRASSTPPTRSSRKAISSRSERDRQWTPAVGNLVIQELDQGRTTLVDNDFSGFIKRRKSVRASYADGIAKLLDGLYAAQEGIGALGCKSSELTILPSQSLFRRNWGPKCHAPLTEKNPACSAIPGCAEAYRSAFIRTRSRPSPTSARCSKKIRTGQKIDHAIRRWFATMAKAALTHGRLTPKRTKSRWSPPRTRSKLRGRFWTMEKKARSKRI